MVERVAVVTGTDRGIGLAIVRELARKGLRVVLAARDPARGEAARAQLTAEGLTAAVHPLDVRDAAQAGALAQWLARDAGRVDVLVNNAGVLIDPKGARLAELDTDVLRKTLEANFYGPLTVVQALAPLMRKGGYGRIINLSSALARLQDMGGSTPAYRISATALNALTRILSAELAGTGIKVNAMCPGWVRTDMGGPSAARSVEEGADTAVWLATLPDNGPSGGFFQNPANALPGRSRFAIHTRRSKTCPKPSASISKAAPNSCSGRTSRSAIPAPARRACAITRSG